MYLRSLSLGFFTAAILMIVIGCSSNPSIPDEAYLNSESLPGIGSVSQSVLPEEIGLFGVYELSLNGESMTAELYPKRISSIGESFTVSAMNFFIMEPCANCLQLESIGGTPEGAVDVGFSIRHPFDIGDTGKPPTARNRRDLDIFDMAMVVAPQEVEPSVYEGIGKYVYDKVLLESSGYTTELASLVQDDSAMPYQLVVDDSITGVRTYNVFGMGAESFFDVYFKPPPGKYVGFDLYLTTAYGAAATKSTFLQPTYYNPEFNRKAAWKIEVVPPEGIEPPNVDNTWSDNDPETERFITVKVYDWQVGATVNPELTNLTDVAEMSEVSDVLVEIPGMGVFAMPGPAHDGTGDGGPDAPLVYHFPMTNAGLMEAGEYTGLVKVVDTRMPGTIDDIDHLINTPDGIQLDHYTIPEYVTYQTFTATVVNGLPGVVFQQIDYTFEDTIVKDSAYGKVRVNYIGDPDVQYFNLSVDGVWVVENMPLYPFQGPGNLHSVNFTFPLGVPDGTDVTMINYGFQIDPLPIVVTPPPIGSAYVYADAVVFYLGKDSTTFFWPPFFPEPLKIKNPGPSNFVSFPGPNQECNENECVPAAVSNSLTWLNQTTGTPKDSKPTDIDTMRSATGCTDDGAPAGWPTLKEEYTNVNGYNVNTQGYPEPPISGNEATEAQCDAAMAALAAGADVEIDGGHHVAMVVGMTKGVDEFGFPKYTITVVHDTAQGQSGGCQAETITYCPPVANPSPPPPMFQSETDGGTPGFFDNDIVNGFVSESPK